MATLKRQALRVILLVAFFSLVTYLVKITDPRHVLRVSLMRISDLGPWAPFWFVMIYIVACLTFFPGFILTMGAGILFGAIQGTILVTIGATIGAGCAFLISRYLVRSWVTRRFARNPKFRAIDDAVAADGWKIVGLIRLSPVFPFIPMNFVFGVTRIPFWHFFFATWVGIIPVSFLFVYLGTLLGDIAALGTQPIAAGKAQWILSGVGMLTAVVVTYFITGIARRALAARMPEGNEAVEE
jgi:uncharacterized membrane protein YdjX (TVP38/TMEM64 family)